MPTHRSVQMLSLYYLKIVFKFKKPKFRALLEKQLKSDDNRVKVVKKSKRIVFKEVCINNNNQMEKILKDNS